MAMDSALLEKLREANTLNELLELYYETEVDADVVIHFAYRLGKAQKEKK